MTTEELEELFTECEDIHFLEFKQLKNKRSKCPDIHAFLLLDELVPGKNDIISAAEHDEVYLSVDLEKLAKVITKEQVIELIQCGVRFSEFECLAMMK